MQVIEDKIYNKVKKCGRGTVFSSSDFTAFREPRSVLKALEEEIIDEMNSSKEMIFYIYRKLKALS